MSTAIRAVLWDFGGAFTESPLKAFAAFERSRGLPDNFLRRVNSLDTDANAWARFERGEVSLAEFGDAFEAESRAGPCRARRRGAGTRRIGDCTAA